MARPGCPLAHTFAFSGRERPGKRQRGIIGEIPLETPLSASGETLASLGSTTGATGTVCGSAVSDSKNEKYQIQF
jgi:hypothetical protein